MRSVCLASMQRTATDPFFARSTLRFFFPAFAFANQTQVSQEPKFGSHEPCLHPQCDFKLISAVCLPV